MITLEGEKRRKIIILISTLIGSLLLGWVFSSYIKKPRPQETTLKVWGFDSSDTMDGLFSIYRKQYPYIKFKYTQVGFDTYENNLLEALSSGKSPDIFLIRNDWLPRYENKIQPFSSKKIKMKNITNLFADNVFNDFTDKNQLWALPSYIDTLALYYNKDIFNSNNIPIPPKTWNEFTKIAKQLTQINNETGQLEVSGGAIGSAENINHSEDLFNLLFLQKLSNSSSKKNKREILKDTLNFYTSFANPKSDKYVWDRSLHYSIDAFSEGKVAMIFNYHFQKRIIESRNPNLNFQIVKMIQFKNGKIVNFANYWGWTVSIFSKHPKEAWNFIVNLTTNPLASYYLEKTGNPPALRSLIKKYLDDPEIGLFCSQALTAKNIVSKNNTILYKSITETIEEILSGQIKIDDGVSLIGEKMNL